MWQKRKRILMFLILAPMVCGFFGGVVMVLWNWLMPEIFGLPTLSFWQAAGLLLLSKILFSSIGPKHRGRPPFAREGRQKWKGMTPEAREKLKTKLEKKWFGSCADTFGPEEHTEQDDQTDGRAPRQE